MAALKIGIVGAGAITTYAHMPVFAADPRVSVVAISDQSSAAAAAAADNFGIPQVFTDYNEMIANSGADVIDICVPHYLHYPVAMAAFAAGKDVICEKPIAMNLDEADAMIAEAKATGRRFLTVLNQRYLPIHRKVKEYITEGKLGKPFLANGIILGNVIDQINDPNHWKSTWEYAGGGVLFDTGTHMIDLMHYWFGYPTAVSGVLRKLMSAPDNKADDNACVTLEYPDMMVNIVLSYSVEHEPWTEKKFVYGSGGDLSVISEAAVPMFYISGNAPEMVDVEHNPNWGQLSHRLALTDLIDSLIDGSATLVTAEDARAALRTILAAYESSASGEKVILG